MADLMANVERWSMVLYSRGPTSYTAVVVCTDLTLIGERVPFKCTIQHCQLYKIDGLHTTAPALV
eukprot:scaffold457666_cov22-Prasinocladus_malaysianus.AAC.1